MFFNCCFLGLFKKIHYSFTLLSGFRMCYCPNFKDEWDFAFRCHYKLTDSYIFMCFSPLQSLFLWSSNCLWEPLLVGSYVLFLFFFFFNFLLRWVCCCVKAFSTCSRRGLLSSCGTWASHQGGFSYCRTQVLGAWASVVAAHELSSCGSQALQHVGFSSCGAQAQ